MPQITVIDYGIGNLLSVTRAFEHCGANVILTDNMKLIAEADYLVLPGVGAFADGMSGLRGRGLIEPIKEFILKERPFLGICLGMQMMLTESEEFGINEGLGIIPGKVTAIPAVTSTGNLHKIPHIGWNGIHASTGICWDNSILSTTPNDAPFYFVHSYTAVPVNDENRLADCCYNGQIISAVIRKGYAYGCQFHPEKSGNNGLNMLRSFMGMIS